MPEGEAKGLEFTLCKGGLGRGGSNLGKERGECWEKMEPEINIPEAVKGLVHR